MRVAVAVGDERRELRAGERADFPGEGLSVKVMASVAVQDEAANALEGEPYRLEVLAWRSRGS